VLAARLNAPRRIYTCSVATYEENDVQERERTTLMKLHFVLLMLTLSPLSAQKLSGFDLLNAVTLAVPRVFRSMLIAGVRRFRHPDSEVPRG
jgi:hypothetical protein